MFLIPSTWTLQHLPLVTTLRTKGHRVVGLMTHLCSQCFLLDKYSQILQDVVLVFLRGCWIIFFKVLIFAQMVYGENTFWFGILLWEQQAKD